MNQPQTNIEIVRGAEGTLAFVEVKNLPDLSVPLAAELRRELLAASPSSARGTYFAVISQDRAFLWEPRQSDSLDAEPAAAFAMRPVLRAYLPDAVLDQHLRGAELEIAVQQWLNDMTRGWTEPATGIASLEKFAQHIRGGEVHSAVHP